MPDSKSSSNWRLLHGVVLVILMAAVALLPAFRSWPWIWAIPLLAYFAIILLIRPLRSSMRWPRLGKVSATAAGATFAIMAATTVGLVWFNVATHPQDLQCQYAVPFQHMGGIIMAGIIFTVLNATLEEVVFRGVLFDAVQSQWEIPVTVIGTGVLFGLGHMNGYPPGFLGACMAGVFGIGMGILRHWSGGLLLPIIAHMGADATIYSILVDSGMAV